MLTPIGLIARLCGKDFLVRKHNKQVISYWMPRKTAEPDKESYEQQF
jgi:hypothetical protein